MLRALMLISAIVFFREFLLRPARRSPTAISPYMNSLDGLLSAEQVSRAVEEVRLGELQMKRARSFAGPISPTGDGNLARPHPARPAPHATVLPR
jgi:hypothetical protein